jgi:hypothetical protein
MIRTLNAGSGHDKAVGPGGNNEDAGDRFVATFVVVGDEDAGDRFVVTLVVVEDGVVFLVL